METSAHLKQGGSLAPRLQHNGVARPAAPWRCLLAPMAALALVAACKDEVPAPAADVAPPAVFVARVERQTITDTAEFIGRVEAIGKVDVRARVTGFLQTRHFDEGQEVKENDLLFTIDQAPFAAEVALQQARLERAQAELRNASLQVQRGQELVRTSALSRATLDDRISVEGQAQGELGAAQARLQQARIEYGYTEIRSPLAGRAGRSPLTPGNVVSPETGTLVTIVRDDSVRIVFPVTQRQLLTFRRAGNGGGIEQIRVGVRLPDGSQLETMGRLEFIDVTANRSTDSVLVQALVPNPQHLLTDGQAVTAVVQSGAPQEAITVPQSAIQIDQAGTFALVVGQDNKVEVRRIRTGRGASGQVVVTEGLEVGQLVITEGSQRARPGAPVSPRPMPGIPGDGTPASPARPG